ncbi:SIR2 family NAD-dependent protein deacylase [Urechidicola croceus]|uniref:NAD-dependent protein deacylase n=1 Tax=Urechidicola croceus TaxID=1850246 RepID=A0A1D8P583_9FLAO|nr:NAD-dependent deacylase [Urechidicola croceus]AOW19681.1 NAD-dependent protein deacylase [Urechidicola croceus]
MLHKKRIVVLTGAGISAESGIKTFRDSNGLWEGHNIQDVATPQGWYKNPELVLDFYNQRRKQLLQVKPNDAHLLLSKLEEKYDVNIITQNVDDLHERSGSTKVTHLHGELRKVRSTIDEYLIYNWDKDLNIGDHCECNSQLRPHIVWFGEEVPNLTIAEEITQTADILIIIGTSMQVYPAANLIHFAQKDIPIYFIDPKPNINKNQFDNLNIISDMASQGLKKIYKLLN